MTVISSSRALVYGTIRTTLLASLEQCAKEEQEVIDYLTNHGCEIRGDSLVSLIIVPDYAEVEYDRHMVYLSFNDPDGNEERERIEIEMNPGDQFENELRFCRDPEDDDALAPIPLMPLSDALAATIAAYPGIVTDDLSGAMDRRFDLVDVVKATFFTAQRDGKLVLRERRGHKPYGEITTYHFELGLQEVPKVSETVE